jgi:hypothetical protein
MPEIRSTDHPDELTNLTEDLAPRPLALKRPDRRAAPDESERQSPPPRAIRPISSDCNERRAPARTLPLRIRPSRGLNVFSSSAIREDMRVPAKPLKYLAN